MLNRIKIIVSRSPATLIEDASGALAITALFAVMLHLPAII